MAKEYHRRRQRKGETPRESQTLSVVRLLRHQGLVSRGHREHAECNGRSGLQDERADFSGDQKRDRILGKQKVLKLAPYNMVLLRFFRPEMKLRKYAVAPSDSVFQVKRRVFEQLAEKLLRKNTSPK